MAGNPSAADVRIKRASKAKSFEEDHEAGELDKPRKFWAWYSQRKEDAVLPLDPGEEGFNEPTSLF